MTNRYLEKVASRMDAIKAGVGKFARAFKGVDVKDTKALLKRTPVDRANLGARMDLTKRLKGHQKDTLMARGAVGGTTAAVGGVAAYAAKKKD